MTPSHYQLDPSLDRLAKSYAKHGNLKAAVGESGALCLWELPTQGFYVYLLCDSRDSSVFYVGKGKGNRALQHEIGWKNSVTCNWVKSKIIGDIKKSGGNIDIAIIARSESENLCYSIEREFIKAWADLGLTNIKSGVVSSIESSYARLLSLEQRIRPRREVAALYPLLLQHYDEFIKSIQKNKQWLEQRMSSA